MVECHSVPVPSREKVILAQVHDRAPPEPGPETGYTELWEPPVDEQHLNQEQHTLVKPMFREEADIFYKDNMDIGHIENLQMEITLTDNIPVAKRLQWCATPLVC
jgi:hypothetical protein